MEPDDPYWRRPASGEGADATAPHQAQSRQSDAPTPAPPTLAPNAPSAAPDGPPPARPHPAVWRLDPVPGPVPSPAGGTGWTGPDLRTDPMPSGPAFAGLGYQGPPPSSAPPAGWHPSRIVEPAPPRRLPGQDHAAIDSEEATARTLTRGLGLLAGAVLILLLCALCGRVLF